MVRNQSKAKLILIKMPCRLPTRRQLFWQSLRQLIHVISSAVLTFAQGSVLCVYFSLNDFFLQCAKRKHINYFSGAFRKKVDIGIRDRETRRRFICCMLENIFLYLF